MKNLIDPQELAIFKSKPASYESILDFLDSHPKVAAGYICKVVGIPAGNFYAWRARKQKTPAKGVNLNDLTPGGGVIPVGMGKRKYSAEDKVSLLREYSKLDRSRAGEFLRSYGLYETDIERWQSVAE
jgi:hypothetical protein